MERGSALCETLHQQHRWLQSSGPEGALEGLYTGFLISEKTLQMTLCTAFQTRGTLKKMGVLRNNKWDSELQLKSDIKHQWETTGCSKVQQFLSSVLTYLEWCWNKRWCNTVWSVPLFQILKIVPAIKLKMSIYLSAQLHVRKQIEMHNLSPTAAPGEQKLRKYTDIWINNLLIVCMSECMSACVFLTNVLDNDGGKLQRCWSLEADRDGTRTTAPSEAPKRTEGWKPKGERTRDKGQLTLLEAGPPAMSW